MGLSDGSILLLSGSGKEEKRIKDAHVGTVTHVSFGSAGQSLVSAGEDGAVKLWSRNGQCLVRSVLFSYFIYIYIHLSRQLPLHAVIDH